MSHHRTDPLRVVSCYSMICTSLSFKNTCICIYIKTCIMKDVNILAILLRLTFFLLFYKINPTAKRTTVSSPIILTPSWYYFYTCFRSACNRLWENSIPKPSISFLLSPLGPSRSFPFSAARTVHTLHALLLSDLDVNARAPPFTSGLVFNFTSDRGQEAPV